MSDQPALTPEQKTAARKEAKRKADRDRLARIKKIDDICQTVDFGDRGSLLYADLDADQRKRALELDKYPGLGASAKGTFILTGMGIRNQVAVARQAAKNTPSASPGSVRSSPRTPKDPEAAALVAKAMELITDEETGEKILKSAFLPKDAREFLDEFTVEKPDGSVIITSRKRENLRVEFSRAALEAFAIAKEKKPEVRQDLVRLGNGTRLWGGKLAVFILAS